MFASRPEWLRAACSWALLSSVVGTVTASPASTGAGDGERAPSQAGVFEGANPIAYSSSNPIQLFIVQAIIVIVVCQLLAYPLRWLNQPRVIAEVIGGIILGPSVMMRIPGFKAAIFPDESMPVFNNVANFGLIIFLFIVALEVDMRLFMLNWRIAATVSVAGMILPFGLGCAISWGLYHEFSHDTTQKPVSFGVYALFIGTALAITAFPVLCRILTELKLLSSNVGVTVLAAGIGNDVVGWILLALCVALVNNSSGLMALWVLLCTVGWVLVLVFIVRPLFMHFLRRTGSLQNGPSPGIVALTLIMVLLSAWYTAIIGVHPIFGAFLVGLIYPHDGGFVIKLTEKIEDFISVFFLPLYFALSGLKTDLGLLDDAITWAYVIGVLAVAFSGKIIGGTLAARCFKFRWRECWTIGCLMSCKGLVELIVLNIGLQAKILTQRTFTIFVVMALVTTVATTPLTKLLYPPWYQRKLERWRRGEIDWDGNELSRDVPSPQEVSQEKLDATRVRRLLLFLRLDSLPSLFTFISLLGSESTVVGRPPAAPGELSKPPFAIRRRPLEVHGLRMIELTDRTSSVMQVTENDDYYSQADPVVNAFRTFSQLHDVAVSGRAAVVPTNSYGETLMQQAAEVSADFALIPWSETGAITDEHAVPYAVAAAERFCSSAHLDFIKDALSRLAETCMAGVFISNGFGGLRPPHALTTTGSAGERPPLNRNFKSGTSIRSLRSQVREPAAMPVLDKSHHIFFPFIGGVDDRAALRFVLQLAENPNVTMTIAYFIWSSSPSPSLDDKSAGAVAVANGKAPDATATTTAISPPTSSADTAEDAHLMSAVQASLPRDLQDRVTFSEVPVESRNAIFAETVGHAQTVVGQNRRNAGDIVVVGRRHARLAEPGSYELARTIGVLGEKVLSGGVAASLLIIQAGRKEAGPLVAGP